MRDWQEELTRWRLKRSQLLTRFDRASASERRDLGEQVAVVEAHIKRICEQLASWS